MKKLLLIPLIGILITSCGDGNLEFNSISELNNYINQLDSEDELIGRKITIKNKVFIEDSEDESIGIRVSDKQIFKGDESDIWFWGTISEPNVLAIGESFTNMTFTNGGSSIVAGDIAKTGYKILNTTTGKLGFSEVTEEDYKLVTQYVLSFSKYWKEIYEGHNAFEQSVVQKRGLLGAEDFPWPGKHTSYGEHVGDPNLEQYHIRLTDYIDGYAWPIDVWRDNTKEFISGKYPKLLKDLENGSYAIIPNKEIIEVFGGVCVTGTSVYTGDMGDRLKQVAEEGKKCETMLLSSCNITIEFKGEPGNLQNVFIVSNLETITDVDGIVKRNNFILTYNNPIKIEAESNVSTFNLENDFEDEGEYIEE